MLVEQLQSSNILVVSHDAGGAEVLSSFIKNNQLSASFVLAGPASTIFQRKLPSVIDSYELSHISKQFDVILTGTSWQSDLEYKALQIAQDLSIKSFTFLDHWVNYQERFTRHSVTVFPDEIIVGDRFALELAKQIFLDTVIDFYPNQFLFDTRKLASLSSDITAEQSTILYVNEPLSAHAELRYNDPYYWGYTENDAIKYFFKHIHVLFPDVKSVIFRPHPSEKNISYDWVKGLTTLDVDINSEVDLIDQILSVSLVFGCESMALVLASELGKRVISCIPPCNHECSLPLPNIESLKFLLSEKK